MRIRKIGTILNVGDKILSPAILVSFAQNDMRLRSLTLSAILPPIKITNAVKMIIIYY